MCYKITENLWWCKSTHLAAHLHSPYRQINRHRRRDFTTIRLVFHLIEILFFALNPCCVSHSSHAAVCVGALYLYTSLQCGWTHYYKGNIDLFMPARGRTVFSYPAVHAVATPLPLTVDVILYTYQLHLSLPAIINGPPRSE